MRQLVIALAAAFVATACANAAQGHEARRDAPVVAERDVDCAITARRTAHGAEFSARAYAAYGLDGEYELVLTKTGADGSSDIMQSGEFALGPDDETVLGVAELSLERGARGRARLTVWDGEREVCRAVRRL